LHKLESIALSTATLLMMLPHNNLLTYRQIGDEWADTIVTTLVQNGQMPVVGHFLRQLTYNQQVTNENNIPNYLQEYLDKLSQLPSWADTRQIQLAVKFFEKNIENIAMLLGVYSLPYCYAAADGARVLVHSQRIVAQTRRRLAETAQFVLEVLSPDAFRPTGKAFRSIAKVRLYHAVMRHHILQKGEWNMAWGLPINQMDMAGTNLSFSYIVLEGLRKIGVTTSFEEAQAYLHLWAVVGEMLGVQNELLPQNSTNAKILCDEIIRLSFQKSDAGILLMKALLEAFQTTPPFHVLKGFAPTYIRFLVGDDVGDLLEIPTANWTSNFIPLLKMRNMYRSAVGFSPKEIQENVNRMSSQILSLSQATTFVHEH
jgi:hypothetical protein